MVEALGSPGAFFVPKLPLFRGKNRLKLPNYYPTKRQIPLEIRVACIPTELQASHFYFVRYCNIRNYMLFLHYYIWIL